MSKNDNVISPDGFTVGQRVCTPFGIGIILGWENDACPYLVKILGHEGHSGANASLVAGSMVDAKEDCEWFGAVALTAINEPTPQNHDEHYRNLEFRGVEPIVVMESVICNGLPSAYHDIARRNLNIAMSVKYAMRLGEKDAPEKEMDKMDNYVHRAIHGEWRK